jgi:hypothetical protein
MIVGGMTATPFASIQAGQDLSNGKPIGDTALDFTKTVGYNALFAGIPLGNAASTGRIWSPLSRGAAFISPAQQILIPQVMRAGMQQYVDAKEYLHGPNDPNNPDDQVRMSQLEAQHPLNTQIPDTTLRTDDPNQ